ncbi:MAG: hypothetical protein ACC655_09415, partial [Rhodothermia bacterium]
LPIAVAIYGFKRDPRQIDSGKLRRIKILVLVDVGHQKTQLEKLCELSEKEIGRTSGTPCEAAAHMYRERFARARELFDRCSGNLVTGFRRGLSEPSRSIR